MTRCGDDRVRWRRPDLSASARSSSQGNMDPSIPFHSAPSPKATVTRPQACACRASFTGAGHVQGLMRVGRSAYSSCLFDVWERRSRFRISRADGPLSFRGQCSVFLCSICSSRASQQAQRRWPRCSFAGDALQSTHIRNAYLVKSLSMPSFGIQVCSAIRPQSQRLNQDRISWVSWTDLFAHLGHLADIWPRFVTLSTSPLPSSSRHMAFFTGVGPSRAHPQDATPR